MIIIDTVSRNADFEYPHNYQEYLSSPVSKRWPLAYDILLFSMF